MTARTKARLWLLYVRTAIACLRPLMVVTMLVYARRLRLRDISKTTRQEMQALFHRVLEGTSDRDLVKGRLSWVHSHGGIMVSNEEALRALGRIRVSKLEDRCHRRFLRRRLRSRVERDARRLHA